MAKFNLSYDSIEKTHSCTIDGQDVPNIYSFGMYRNYDDDMMVEVATMEKLDDMTKMMRIVAADSEKGKQALKDGGFLLKNLPGFIAYEDKSETQKDVMKYLSK